VTTPNVLTSSLGYHQLDMASPSSSSATRYICIHGHFYQPPRENPWLEAVEIQDSAAPYHDWNERITAECYAPNGASRLVNGQNQIIRIVNNYSRISFDFGPTLLSWLEQNAPRTYRMILEGDRKSSTRYGGHGSAMAQAYNHVIMPLANKRDRVTQIEWGMADFAHRFGRKPEGMWLPETAVDRDTLDLLAQRGIRFTVLAPHQCARVRDLAESTRQPMLPDLEGAGAKWTETTASPVDIHRPYLVRLREGRTIAVFFYNGPLSRAIAFEGLLNNGENFAMRLTGDFDSSASSSQLVHVATDGESYGHHHKHGEMALSYALKLIEDSPITALTNYGQFLDSFPPTWEAEVADDTSWSCTHGVARWRSDCGCNGGHPGWNQKWRTPLRAAMDWLRDTLARLTERTGRGLFKDVWAARNAYIAVVLAEPQERHAAVDRFVASHGARAFSSADRILALKLMEMQRNALLMYASCAWFFDDISGIETVQAIACAARAIQLAAAAFGLDRAQLEAQFFEKLGKAESNVSAWQNGAKIYNLLVRPLEVGLEQVAAHYAISSFFSNYPAESTLFCYTVRRLDYETVASGRGRLAMGRALVSSKITEESETVCFAALSLGDQNVTAAVKRFAPEDLPAFAAFQEKCGDAINHANVPEAVRIIDSYFGGSPYSLVSLFSDDRRRVLRVLLKATLGEVENSLAKIYEEHASLVHFMSSMGLPKPPALIIAAGFAVNAGLRRALEEDVPDLDRIEALIALAKADDVPLAQHELSYQIDQSVKRALVALEADPLNFDHLERTIAAVHTLREFPFPLNLWQPQNIWHDMLIASPAFLRDLEQPSAAERWRERFLQLGREMGIAVEQLVVEDDAPAMGEESANLGKAPNRETATDPSASTTLSG
jgi:alpha-amylase/alpha-mannosidase (GH57 family)